MGPSFECTNRCMRSSITLAPHNVRDRSVLVDACMHPSIQTCTRSTSTATTLIHGPEQLCAADYVRWFASVPIRRGLPRMPLPGRALPLGTKFIQDPSVLILHPGLPLSIGTAFLCGRDSLIHPELVPFGQVRNLQEFARVYY